MYIYVIVAYVKKHLQCKTLENNNMGRTRQQVLHLAHIASAHTSFTGQEGRVRLGHVFCTVITH